MSMPEMLLFESIGKSAIEDSRNIQSGLLSNEKLKTKEELYNGTKAIIKSIESKLNDLDEKMTTDDTYINPCFKAGYMLNQIMIDINILKDTEKHLDNIDIFDFKWAIADLSDDLIKFTYFLNKCSTLLKNHNMEDVEYG